ncbi:hypothetical protein [Solidesulfovibrio alcoholivorans]|uniref:hypothetical protein n=1 Tax=Solidesulfovibrio alcoholivorans TaxID=81406 RepID=UPI0004972608|nr:hypothetical protein [Solidesulfovibrio alcoholivorans]
MSRKKPDPEPDLFSSVPPRETFAAFPTLDAFPEQAIAFLTGKGAAEPVAPRPAPQAPAVARAAAPETRPVSRPHVKPEKKPVTKPVSRPAAQPAGQSVSPPVSPPGNQPDGQPDSRGENRTASPSASLSPAQQACQPARQPASLSEDPTRSLSESHTPDGGAGLSASPSASQSPNRTFSPFPGLSGPGDRLNANQRGVLEFLLRARPYIVKFRDIAAALGMREATVRTILRRLAALGILAFKKARDGNIQGVRLEFHQAVLAQYGCDLSASQAAGLSWSLSASHSEGRTPPEPDSRTVGHTEGPTTSPSESRTAALQAGQPAGQPAATAASLRKEREDLSLFPENAFGWDDEFLAMMWPAVRKAGFRVEQIRQAVAARARLDKALDMESVRVSLDRADWELETTGRLTELGSGEAVKNPQAYVFTALARWGMLRAHPDYVSREEVEAASAAAELKRRREAAAKLEEARFESWRASLGEEDLARALAGCPGGPKEQWLRNYWRRHGQGG